VIVYDRLLSFNDNRFNTKLNKHLKLSVHSWQNYYSYVRITVTIFDNRCWDREYSVSADYPLIFLNGGNLKINNFKNRPSTKDIDKKDLHLYSKHYYDVGY